MSQSGALQFSRRTMLGSPLLLAAPALSAQPELADDVRTYVGMGEHRAGTRGERKTISWLGQRLRRLGYSVEKQTFPIQTLLDPGGELEVEDYRTRLFPQWLPPPNALNKTISSQLVDLDSPQGPQSIRLLSKPAKLTANWSEALSGHVQSAHEKGAVAFILSIDDPSHDLFVCNQHYAGTFPIPVLLIATRELARLKSKIGKTVKIKIWGKFQKTHALNIIGKKDGIGPAIVLSTPLTGWFHCGAERGPGIALWLRQAARLARQSRPVVMLGTGSHEIGHLGMEYALEHGAPTADTVGFWFHFGASLAATRLDQKYQYKSGQYLVGTEVTSARAKQLLGSVMPFYVPGTAETLGESGQIIGAGHANFIGMSGQFPTFHTPLDKGEAIDFAQLERISAAVDSLFDTLKG